jgi:hypothetical protein
MVVQENGGSEADAQLLDRKQPSKNRAIASATEAIELSSHIPSDPTRKPSELKKLPNNRDVIGSVIGPIGRWQYKSILLIMLCKIPAAWFMACIIFTAPTPRHGEFYCKPPKVSVLSFFFSVLLICFVWKAHCLSRAF